MGNREEEVCYYEIPCDQPVIAFLEEHPNKMLYGNGADCMHFHNYLEIGYCRKGKGTIAIGENTYPYEEKMLFIIPPGFKHRMICRHEDSSWEYLFIDIDSFLKNYYRKEPVFAQMLLSRAKIKAFFMRDNDSPALAGLIFGIMRELKEMQEFYRESVKGRLLALLLELVRMNDRDKQTELASDQDVAQIVQALEYVNANYCKSIKIEELAKACHLSETHFRRIFEEKMGMKPIDYVNRVRVRKACELMGQSDSSMAEVALRAGFSNSSTFNRNFKKIVGISPYQWKINGKLRI